MYGLIERDVMGSESSNKRRTKICVTGRGVAFRGVFSLWRRGVSSSTMLGDIVK
jgi:hypothetical protein